MGKCQSVETMDGFNIGSAEGVSWVERLKTDAGEVDRQLQTKDFIGIGERLKRLEEDVRRAVELNSFEKELLELQRQVWGMVAFMGTEPVCSTAREQEKWAAAGFDRSLVTTDPEAVHFAVSSKLIYTISMYASASKYLDGEPMAIMAVQGRAHFKVEGEWKPYSAFKNQIRYSEERRSFVGWNFIHPAGFVPQDWVDYDHIYPIAKLNTAGICAAAAHAQKFWGTDQPEVDPGIEKPYVLQVIATRKEPEGASKAWWLRHFQEKRPDRHTSFRLITPDGDLYSFGIAIRHEDEALLSSIGGFLTTGLAKVPIPDYEESRKADGRVTVALPLSQERAKKILDFADAASKGIPFNIAQQNCAKFADTVIELAGVAVESRVPLSQLVFDGLPRFSDAPYLGGAAAAISKIAAPVFAKIPSMAIVPCPSLVKHVWSALGEAGSLIAACVINIASIAFFGAGASTGSQRKMSWRTLLSREMLKVYSPAQLEQWMLAQHNAIQRN